MKETNCSCESLERLEGASVPAYTKAFLENVDASDPAQKNLYRCRACGRTWEERKGETARPSLVRTS